ncbi:SDR family NAD(P)-dependent oxidoreductase [Vannielia litorea]|uniref:NADP-dependent 3-hydroxy acid dehydrogenase YdfG n=1 Tax=Vannielia litorea TaxID=1217970 RepID=A0A1N6HA00_9RHOB|nr:SDR family NAD(P)-dependent oxidoreductase [Vannielia litorea]SIO16507.1 NADP-dependent 3-hydroxy acid dehydrogenase YdfG [Vannielia litorea]
MVEWQGKRYWIIGAGSALGRAIADQLSRVGVELLLTCSEPEAMARLAEMLPGKAEVLEAEVSDGEAMKSAVASAGRLDGVIYLPDAVGGHGARTWDTAAIKQVIDRNLDGALNTVGAVLPGMVAADKGHLLLVAGLSAYRGLPGEIGYGTSMAAIMHLAEELYAELRSTGVQIQLACPGHVIEPEALAEGDTPAALPPSVMTSEAAARELFEHMNDDIFQRSFPTMRGWVVRLSQLMPNWLYYRLFRSQL